jgi:hypothetical protein
MLSFGFGVIVGVVIGVQAGAVVYILAYQRQARVDAAFRRRTEERLDTLRIRNDRDFAVIRKDLGLPPKPYQPD